MRKIKGFPGYYVTINGRVLSDVRSILKVMKPRKHSTGYPQAVLAKNGKPYYRYIHRLVLEAYVGPCPPGYQCDHINGIRHDNRLENLRWVTRKQNMRFISKRRGNNWNKGENHPAAILTNEIILEIRKLFSQGKRQKDISDLFNLGQGYVSLIVNRKIWKHI